MLVKIKQTSGVTVAVNLDHIVIIIPYALDDKSSLVELSNEMTIFAAEPFDELTQRIKEGLLEARAELETVT